MITWQSVFFCLLPFFFFFFQKTQFTRSTQSGWKAPSFQGDSNVRFAGEGSTREVICVHTCVFILLRNHSNANTARSPFHSRQLSAITPGSIRARNPTNVLFATSLTRSLLDYEPIRNPQDIVRCTRQRKWPPKTRKVFMMMQARWANFHLRNLLSWTACSNKSVVQFM